MLSRFSARRATIVAALVALLPGLGVSVARADDDPGASGAPGATASAPVVPRLAWKACGTAPAGTAAGVQCAVAALPLDYDRPAAAQVHIAVARVPARDRAHRIGSMFFNFGGPGAPAVDFLQSSGAGLFATLNQRFDIVAFDPRGVGQSSPAIDCRVNQETEGIVSQPFPTPLTVDEKAFVGKTRAYVTSCLANNGPILAHVSTANVARDLDVLRAAVGDRLLTYFGFSYGTFLGATYAVLFPHRYRALLLDGPLDARQYLHDPLGLSVAQAAAFEEALQRFLAACAADQHACSGFGGGNPRVAYDDLVAGADTRRIPATAYTPDPRPVSGDDIRAATVELLYAKQFWGVMGLALARAVHGDGTTIRAIVDQLFYRRRDDGTFDPLYDRLFVISASEQLYPRGDVQVYFRRGAASWAEFPHFWWNSGYPEMPNALWPNHDQDAYEGSFRLPSSSPTPLVVATTHDPATPYRGALNLIAELGNARLLTMNGDGHTAYGSNSPCVNAAVEAYLVALTLPARGTVCTQQVPFTAPAPVTAGAAGSVLSDAPGSGRPSR
jgi:pimeloyl-ACP methyl ester carboxylesterase